jgi:hypothetical protein
MGSAPEYQRVPSQHVIRVFAGMRPTLRAPVF